MMKNHITTTSEQEESFGKVLVCIGTFMLILSQVLLNVAMLLCGPCNPMLFPVGLVYFLSGGILVTVGVILWDRHLQLKKTKAQTPK